MSEFLRSYRRQNRLTQAELAERLGCSQSLISFVEKGEQNISYDRAKEWGAALGVHPGQLRPPPYPADITTVKQSPEQ